MKRLLVLLLLVLGSAVTASARAPWHDWCWQGNQFVKTSGLNSTTKVQASQSSCTVTIYVHGGGLATIYADNNNTPLANPFTAQTNGQFIWYANDGRYDQTITVTINGTQQTVTMSDILLCDPFVPGAVCAAGGGGGGGVAHNLLSTMHLDTIPFSPPVRGDVITAQNLTSPTSVNPSWARLALGTNGYVLTSNGVDAIWAPAPGGGTGCTLPGIDFVVISEHPVGTCYGSLHWTWDDRTNKQVMLLGDGTNSATTARNTFLVGEANTHVGSGLCCGDDVFMIGNGNQSTNSSTNIFAIGTSNTVNNNAQDWVIGTGNTLQNFGGPNVVIGRNNHLGGATTNQNIFDIDVMGKQNTISTSVGKTISLGVIAGSLNTISSTTNTISGFHILGGSNTMLDTLNLTQEVEIVGEQNEVNGAASTLQILGYKNIAHNVSISGTSDVNTVIVGSANTAINTGASTPFAFQGEFGDQNLIQACSRCYAIGGTNLVGNTDSTNSLTNIAMGSSQIGDTTHANSGGGNNVVIGINSTVFNSRVISTLGSNGVGTATGTGKQTNGSALGGNFIGNCVNSSICSQNGNGAADAWSLVGDGNQIKGTGTSSNVYLMGYLNRGNTAGANISGGGAYEFGLDNEMNGGVGCDTVIVGASNLSTTCGTAGTVGGAQDNFIGGWVNTVTSSSNFSVVGAANTVTSKTNIAVFGFNAATANLANNEVTLGISANPELHITTANVRRPAAAFSVLPACAAGTEGSFAAITDSTTNVWGATITGSGTNHVMGYCDGTNWTVAGK